jgi:hypothetical protein
MRHALILLLVYHVTSQLYTLTAKHTVTSNFGKNYVPICNDAQTYPICL